MRWLDVLVAVALAGFWLGLFAVVLTQCGSLLEAGLVLVVGAALLARWLMVSATVETLRDWLRRD